jgi:methylglutaconyl-CoA hydratase
MKKMATFSEEENLVDAHQLAEMLYQIYTCSKPIIAKIQGDCYAGGMGLVAACDIAVAVDSMQFCLSEVKIGIIPATISPYVIKAMGVNAARRYFVTAERFSAREAHRIGFIHEVTSEQNLDATIAQLVRAIVNNSPNAVREAKRLVDEISYTPIDEDLLKVTAERIAAIRISEDGREGIAAFLERRKPAWLLT